MNPLMRNMQHQHHHQQQQQQQQQQKLAAAKKKNKGVRRPAPPVRSRVMTSPAAAPTQMRTEHAPVIQCDAKLTHLSQLFPDIDNPVIMDILEQKRGNVEAATQDLFQLTNPVSIDATPEPSVPGIDSFELPPCYDELDAEYYFPPEKEVDVHASLPLSTKNMIRVKPVLKQHPDLKRFNTSIGLVRHEAPKDYLLKWQKGKMNWLSVNGKTVLVGPLPDDFLRVKAPPQPTRSKSLSDSTSITSPTYRMPPPLSVGPSDEISRTREGRISPFRLPLKMEELEVPPDPDETENQLFEDHKLAHYLQNVEFLQQVKNNQQLYSAVTQAADDSQLHSQMTLKRMDKATKKKLTKLAKKLPKGNWQQL